MSGRLSPSAPTPPSIAARLGFRLALVVLAVSAASPALAQLLDLAAVTAGLQLPSGVSATLAVLMAATPAVIYALGLGSVIEQLGAAVAGRARGETVSAMPGIARGDEIGVL